MSIWYREGTISLANGSATVNGTGTQFVGNVFAGMALVHEMRVIGEVQSVTDNTTLTLVNNYAGTSITDDPYALVNVGAVRDGLLKAFLDWQATIEGYEDGPLAGLFGDGSAAEPGISFAGATGMGLSRDGNTLRFSTNGVQRALLSSSAFQIDVPVTGTAVTQSLTDTTVGRLAGLISYAGQAGTGYPFGLGSSHAVAINETVLGSNSANDISRAGFYATRTDTTDTPVSGFGHALQHWGFNENIQAQLFIARTSSRMFFRRRNDVWASWAELYHTDNLVGTVSQSGGVPTGAVIERGSNSNGEYVRFADGTQICWRSGIISSGQDSLITTTVQGITLYYSPDTITWSFPAVFSAAPSVSGFCIFRGTGWGAHQQTQFLLPSNTAVDFRHSGYAINSGGDIEFSQTVVGRWF